MTTEPDSEEPAAPKLYLDEKTGEMVSKNELKKREKERQKEADKAAKAATNQTETQQQTSKEYYESRIAEIGVLKQQNASPYPYKVHITQTLREFRDEYEEKIKNADETLKSDVQAVSGRVLSIRKSGANLYFLVIEEETIQLQVYCNKLDCDADIGVKMEYTTELKPNLHTLTTENIKRACNYKYLCGECQNYFAELDHIKRGDIIAVTGVPMRTKTSELSILPRAIQILAPCLHMLPKQNQSISDIEFRYNNRSVDLFMNKKSQILIERIEYIKFIKNVFINKYNFQEVETPILHQVKGGANAKPFITHYNDLGQDVFLRIAPELYLKQLVIGGIERVFEMNRNFRNESIDNTHLPEFTMVESYCAFWDLYDQQEFVQDLLSSLVRFRNVRFFNQRDDESNSELYMVKYEDWNGQKFAIDFRPPFMEIDIMDGLEQEMGKRLGESVRFPRPLDSAECNEYIKDAIGRLVAKKAVAREDVPAEPQTTSRLIDFLVGEFLEKLSPNPVFLMHHPKLMSPLAKPHRDDGEKTERFELFCGMFELCNAYTELNDSQIERENFEAQLKDKDAGDDEACDIDYGFLRAMEHGMVCQSGLGIGIDRLMMLLCGEQSIREVISFPLLRKQK